jgi:hypothetical protein
MIKMKKGGDEFILSDFLIILNFNLIYIHYHSNLNRKLKIGTRVSNKNEKKNNKKN